MSPASKSEAASTKQTIEELQARFQKLDKQKTEAEIHLGNAKKELEKLKKEALEKYKTDDVAELQKILAQMTTENEHKRQKYQTDLDKIETDLAKVEQPAGEGSSSAAGELA